MTRSTETKFSDARVASPPTHLNLTTSPTPPPSWQNILPTTEEQSGLPLVQPSCFSRLISSDASSLDSASLGGRGESNSISGLRCPGKRKIQENSSSLPPPIILSRCGSRAYGTGQPYEYICFSSLYGRTTFMVAARRRQADYWL